MGRAAECQGQAEAQASLQQTDNGNEGGEYVEPSKTTVAQFLERWLKHIKPNVSPRTHERYEQIANKNVVPLLGGKILSKLQPIEISEAYAKALKAAGATGRAACRRAPSTTCTGCSIPHLARRSAGS